LAAGEERFLDFACMMDRNPFLQGSDLDRLQPVRDQASMCGSGVFHSFHFKEAWSWEDADEDVGPEAAPTSAERPARYAPLGMTPLQAYHYCRFGLLCG